MSIRARALARAAAARRQGIAAAPTVPAGPCRIEDAWGLISDPATGKYAHETPSRKELERALAFFGKVVGNDTAWADIDETHYIKAARLRVEELIAKNCRAVRAAEITIAKITTTVGWLSRNRLPDNDLFSRAFGTLFLSKPTVQKSSASYLALHAVPHRSTERENAFSPQLRPPFSTSPLRALRNPNTEIQMGGKRGTLVERFWPKVDKSGECWLWTASKDQHGYGSIYDGQRLQKAHRVSFALAYGPIPPGLDILHACDNPPCVNPAHLRAGTAKDNARDAVLRGQHFTPWKRGDLCHRGHPFGDARKGATPSKPGYRYCRTCARERDARYREQRRALRQERVA